jgi:hypothetical protein
VELHSERQQWQALYGPKQRDEKTETAGKHASRSIDRGKKAFTFFYRREEGIPDQESGPSTMA